MSTQRSIVFTTTAIISLCGLLAGCVGEDENSPSDDDDNNTNAANAVSVAVQDKGSIDIRGRAKVGKIEAFTIKQK